MQKITTMVDVQVPRTTVSLRGTEATVCEVISSSTLDDARINTSRHLPQKVRVRQTKEGKYCTEFVLWQGSTFHVAIDELHIMLENLDTIVGAVIYSRTMHFSAFTSNSEGIVEVIHSRMFNGIHHALVTVSEGQVLHVESTKGN